jgi:hypothetical protein
MEEIMRLRGLSRTPALIGSAFVGAVTLAFTLPGLASAAVTLGNQVPIESTRADSYDFRTTIRNWSVVSLRSSASVNFDLRVRAGSTQVTSRTTSTDFVLIDSNPNERAAGGYTADVLRASGSGGSYSVRFNTSTATFTKPTNAGPSGSHVLRTSSASPVKVLRLDLKTDEGFRLRYPPHTKVYLVNDNPALNLAKVIDRSTADSRNLFVNGQLFGTWIIGDAQQGGCVAFAEPGFDAASTPALVLVDDDPKGSAGKTFYPFAYNRWTDPQQQCPTL